MVLSNVQTNNFYLKDATFATNVLVGGARLKKKKNLQFFSLRREREDKKLKKNSKLVSLTSKTCIFAVENEGRCIVMRANSAGCSTNKRTYACLGCD